MNMMMMADESRPSLLLLGRFRDLTKVPVKPLVKILNNPVFTRMKGLTGTIPHFTSGQT